MAIDENKQKALAAALGQIETGVKMAIDENKQKALAAALGQIEKQFRNGSIMRLGEDRSMDVETNSPGSLSRDSALGAGGLPMCRRV